METRSDIYLVRSRVSVKDVRVQHLLVVCSSLAESAMRKCSFFIRQRAYEFFTFDLMSWYFSLSEQISIIAVVFQNKRAYLFQNKRCLLLHAHNYRGFLLHQLVLYKLLAW